MFMNLKYLCELKKGNKKLNTKNETKNKTKKVYKEKQKNCWDETRKWVDPYINASQSDLCVGGTTACVMYMETLFSGPAMGPPIWVTSSSLMHK